MKALALVALAGCGWMGIEGSNNAKAEVRQVAAFTALEIAAPINVDVTIAPETHLEITGDDNLVPLIITEVSGPRLVIDTRKHLRPHLPLVVHITAPRIGAIEIAGSGTVALHGVHDDALQLELAGSATIHADGAVHQLTGSIVGSGDLQLEQLAAERAEIAITGSGNARLAVAKALDAEITGSGDISYRGAPTVTQHITGSGHVVPR